MAHFNRELVTRLEVEPENATPLGPSPLVAKAERAKGLTAMLLGAEASQNRLEPEPLELSAPKATDCAMLDPLIHGLVDRLPKASSVWSLDDRGKWLRAAAVIFTLIYKLDESDRDNWQSSQPKALL
jgi:hypothetical protein